MRKLMMTLVVVVATMAGVYAQTPNTPDEQLIGIARGALMSHCDNVTGDVSASVSIVSACFVDGFVHRVTFYQQPKCPPGQICPLLQVIRLVGTVTLDCNNNVVEVTCGSTPIPL